MSKPKILLQGKNCNLKRESEYDLEDELKHKKRKKFDHKNKDKETNSNEGRNIDSHSIPSEKLKEKTSWSNEDFLKLLISKK